MILSMDESQALAPELVIVAGIILAIIVPNLGDARVRLPLTSVRVPILWGGQKIRIDLRPTGTRCIVSNRACSRMPALGLSNRVG